MHDNNNEMDNIIDSKNIFESNTAKYGGAISMHGKVKLTLNPKLMLRLFLLKTEHRFMVGQSLLTHLHPQNAWQGHLIVLSYQIALSI